MTKLRYLIFSFTLVFAGTTYCSLAHANMSAFSSETQRKIASTTTDKSETNNQAKKTKEKDEPTARENTQNDNTSSASRWRQMNARDLIR
jgi:hypothetical protein